MGVYSVDFARTGHDPVLVLVPVHLLVLVGHPHPLLVLCLD